MNFSKKHIFALPVLMVTLVLLLTACSGELPGTGDTTAGNIAGTVKVNGSPEADVEVSIPDLNLTDVTDASGVYSFEKVPNGTYDLYFFKEDVIFNELREVVVNGDNVTCNVDITPGGENSLEEAKTFTDELNSNNIQVVQSVNGQVESTGNYMQNDVAPYMESLGFKVSGVAAIMQLWYDTNEAYPDYWLGGMYSGLLEPGEYTFDYNSGLVQLQKYPVDPAETEIWRWDFTLEDYPLPGTNDVSIILTNLKDIISVDENARLTEVDLSDGEFHYGQLLDGNPELYSLTFDFNLLTSSSQTLTITDNYPDPSTGEEVEYTYDVIVPDLGQVVVAGDLVDSLTLSMNGIDYPPVNEVSLNGTLNFDTTPDSSNNYISFDGSFNCDVVSLQGSFNTEFFSFPSYKDLIDETKEVYPEVSLITVDGTLETKYITINDGFTIEFTKLDNEEQTILPSYIELYGNYQYRKYENEAIVSTVNLDGNLSVSADYSTVTDLDQLEGPDNYVKLLVEFAGSYEETDFNPLELDLSVARTGYQVADANVIYSFGGDRYIKAGARMDGNVLKIGAYNEKGIKLSMELDMSSSYDTSTKVGEITDFTGDEKYADIMMIDHQLTVVWADATTTSLLY